MNADTDPPLDPFADRLAARLDRFAEDAGQHAQGEAADDVSDRDEFDRLASGVVAQLREESTWNGPPPQLRATVLARALAADAPADGRVEAPALSAVPEPEQAVDERAPGPDVGTAPANR